MEKSTLKENPRKGQDQEDKKEQGSDLYASDLWPFQSKDLTVSKYNKMIILSVFIEMGILKRTGKGYRIVGDFVVFFKIKRNQ